MGRRSDRSLDELHLGWVRQRAMGQTCGEIGQRGGHSDVAVQVATNRIRAADEMAEGRSLAEDYWS